MNKEEFKHFLAQRVFMRGEVMVWVRYDTGLEHYSKVCQIRLVSAPL